MANSWFWAMALALPSFSQLHWAPCEACEHEYSPEELAIRLVALLPLAVSANATFLGGCTEYTIVVGALPVVW